MKLEGKVAAITGGTAGLGRGIAEAFLAEGAKVALFARNPDKGAKVLEELNVGDRAIFVAGDVMKQSDVEGFIDHTVANFGTIDILVNNAGGAGDLQPMVALSDEAFDEAMKWNVYSTFWASRCALKTMIPNKTGRIINMSSMEGKHGKPVFTRLHCRQARGNRHDQEPRARSGRARHYRELHLPRPGCDRHHQEQWPRDCESDGHGI